MVNCGCSSQTCACIVEGAGDILVTGVGTPAAPYRVSLGLAVASGLIEDAKAAAVAAVIEHLAVNGTSSATWDNLPGKPATFRPTIGVSSIDTIAATDPRLTDQRVPPTNSVNDSKVPDGGLSQAKIAGLTAALAAKVTQAAAGQTSRVYGRDAFAAEVTYPVTETAVAGTIPLRGVNGTVTGGPGTAANHLVNKAQLDTKPTVSVGGPMTIDLGATAPLAGDSLVFNGTTWTPALVSGSGTGGGTTNASDLISGFLSNERLASGFHLVVDYYKSGGVHGAANALPTARPTARTDGCVTYHSPIDPGVTLMIAGDYWDADV